MTRFLDGSEGLKRYTATLSGLLIDGKSEAAATETTPQSCTVCGYQIAPATGESHTHNYEDWQHDDTQHWKACSCGAETGREDHNFGDWITDKEATATETGTKHRDCQTCQYRETENIPATGTESGTGTVTPEVKPGANVPTTDISTPKAELEDMLLTPEEKQQVQNGTDISIILEVQDAGNTVSDTDKKSIEQVLNGFSVGQYLHIDLYKLVGETREDITETANKIRLVIAVPESMRNTDSVNTRAYAVIRMHDGQAETLTDLDSDPNTITIETDRFSTYAIIYRDTPNNISGDQGGDGGNENNGGGNGGNAGNGNNDSNDGGNDITGSNSSHDVLQPSPVRDKEPVTGDATAIGLYATLAMIAGFAYLLLYFSDRKGGMTEETKNALVSRLVAWARRGGKPRKCIALTAIFILLVYYHSIGKNAGEEWKEITGHTA